MTKIRGAMSPSDEEASSPTAPEATIKGSKYLYNFDKVRKWENEERQRRFHHLVRRYISQLVYGCQEPHCKTPTCLSYQRRVVVAPLRRMTPLSARAVATFLASQEDPESGLCPNQPVVPIEFEHKGYAQRRSAQSNDESKSSRGNPAGRGPRNKPLSSPSNIQKHGEDATSKQSERGEQGFASLMTHERDAIQEAAPVPQPINKEPKGKDPKSFTQNLFDTLAMRMLEWVPLRQSPKAGRRPTSVETAAADLSNPKGDDLHRSNGIPIGVMNGRLETSHSFKSPNGSRKTSGSSNNENQRPGIVKKSSNKIPLRPRSVENFEPEQELPHCRTSLRKSSLITPSHSHRLASPPSSPPALKHRKEKHGPLPNGRIIEPEQKQRRGVSWDGSKLLKESEDIASDEGDLEMKEQVISDASGRLIRGPNELGEQEPEKAHSSLQSTSASARIPRTLTYFDYAVVKEVESMLFRAIHENETSRKRWEASRILTHLTPYCHEGSELKKVFDFLEQSIFYVFGFPDQILLSFRKDLDGRAGEVSTLPDTDLNALCYTIRTFWGISLSINVVQAVWRGLEDLFVPPPALIRSRRARKLPTRNLNSLKSDHPKSSESISKRPFIGDSDAAHILFVAFFALAGMLPNIKYDKWDALREARARGYALPDGPHDPDILAVYDALEDEMALRLLYRLMRAISVRMTFFEILKLQSKKSSTSGQSEPPNVKWVHVLDLIIRKLSQELPPADFPVSNLPTHRSYAPNYPGSPNLLSPTISLRLIEWFRTALLKEWNGTPVTSRGSTFGSAVLVLNSFHEHRKSLGIDAAVFHTPRLSQRLDPMQMPGEWLAKEPNNDDVHLLDYSFLLPPSDVVVYFRSINFATMTRAYESTIMMDRLIRHMHFTFHETENPRSALEQRLSVGTRSFLVLEVSRERPLEDTLNQLWKREKREMLRPLKVRIGKELNEEGIDQGGVQQELFRLIMAEVLNPAYGMFTTDERTRMSWFQPCSFESPSKFEMIGLLFSLAIYNGLTLPVTFPIAFYRRLLGLRVKTIDHIQDGWPELSKGLEDLENWTEGDVGDVFMRTYDFSFDAFGSPADVDMTKIGRDDPWPPAKKFKGKGKAKTEPSVPGLTNLEALQIQQSTSAHSSSGSDDWSNIPSSQVSSIPSLDSEAPLVTNANRTQYVKDYIHWLCTKSIAPEFDAFLRGFFVCIDRKALSIFTPESLQAVVEGSQIVDIDALEKATKYDDTSFGGILAEMPYTKDSLPVRWFWEVVRGWDMGKKRKMLEFVTASDRVPVTGTGTIAFSIIRNGAGDRYLPTCHTCFGRLSLPEYSSKAILKERLETAIEHVWGFGVA